MLGVIGRCLLGMMAAGLVFYGAAPGIFIPLLERYLVIAQPLQRADALVLMAGTPLERLPAAARLYHQGLAAKILLTNDGVLAGWSQQHQRNLYHVEWAELELLTQGVPAETIEKLPYSASGTIHDARHAVDFARREGLRSLLLVTSDYHTRRTLWSFQRAAGDDPLSLAVYPVVGNKTSDTRFRRLYILTVEAIKNLYYRWRYASGFV